MGDIKAWALATAMIAVIVQGSISVSHSRQLIAMTEKISEQERRILELEKGQVQ